MFKNQDLEDIRKKRVKEIIAFYHSHLENSINICIFISLGLFILKKEVTNIAVIFMADMTKISNFERILKQNVPNIESCL